MGKLSVGVPYFNAVFVPLMVPVALAMSIGMIARWRSDELQRLWAHLRLALVGSLVLGVLLVLMLTEHFVFRTLAGVLIALWILAGTVVAIRDRIRNAPGIFSGLASLPAAFTGMCLAHAGFAFVIIGISISTQYSEEQHSRMGVGDSVQMSGYTFRLEALQQVDGPNYTATEGVFVVTKGTELVTTIHSQKRYYPVVGTSMTEAGIDGNLFRDLYISLGEVLEGDDWSVRLYFRPFVRWLWLGAILMTLGGLFAACDRRYRLRAEHSRGVQLAPGAVTAASGS
jgi:cytochrome c-type biogenesis protein CcmF